MYKIIKEQTENIAKLEYFALHLMTASVAALPVHPANNEEYVRQRHADNALMLAKCLIKSLEKHEQESERT